MKIRFKPPFSRSISLSTMMNAGSYSFRSTLSSACPHSSAPSLFIFRGRTGGIWARRKFPIYRGGVNKDALDAFRVCVLVALCNTRFIGLRLRIEELYYYRQLFIIKKNNFLRCNNLSIS